MATRSVKFLIFQGRGAAAPDESTWHRLGMQSKKIALAQSYRDTQQWLDYMKHL